MDSSSAATLRPLIAPFFLIRRASQTGFLLCAAAEDLVEIYELPECTPHSSGQVGRLAFPLPARADNPIGSGHGRPAHNYCEHHPTENESSTWTF